MKRIIISLCCLLAPLWALSQEGLGVEDVFEGRVVPGSRIEETMVRGEALHKYRLETFRSVKMEVDSLERHRIETLVLSDGKEAMEHQDEAEYERRGGHLTYCILALPPKRLRRYLCYQCYAPRPSTFVITLVYIEGRATLSELRRTFKVK